MSSPRNTTGHGLVKDAKWLDGVAKPFDALMHGLYGLPGTGWLKVLMHGTWPLRHPLHPAITDVTVGAYTAAVVLDIIHLVTGEPGLERAAYWVLLLAFASSLLAVLSGLTDWRDTYGEEKRTGILHGLIMLSATVAFLVSIVVRANGGPATTAFALALLGWLVMVFGAHLGGELPYGYGTGVNRQAFVDHPTKWQQLDLAAAGLEDRKPVVGKTKAGTQVFVVKIDDRIHAIGNVCTHAGGPLNKGTWIEREGRCMIECPWHHSLFDVRDGSVRQGPATFREPTYEARASESGVLEVRAR